MNVHRTPGVGEGAVPEMPSFYQTPLHENTPAEARAAQVHVADRIASEHPHPLDDVMPRLAARLIAEDPAVADEARELLAMLGLLPDRQVAA